MHFVLRDEVHFQLSKYRFNFSFKVENFLINYLFGYMIIKRIQCYCKIIKTANNTMQKRNKYIPYKKDMRYNKKDFINNEVLVHTLCSWINQRFE